MKKAVLFILFVVTGFAYAQSAVQVDGPISVVNNGAFISSVANNYVSALLNGCNPQAEFYSVQFNNGLTSAVTGCVTGPTTNMGGVYQLNGVSGFATTYNANAVGGYLQARPMANSAKAWGANTVVQDVTGLTAGVVMNSIEADIQAWNPTTAYAAGSGVLAELYTPGGNLGTYNFQAFRVASNRPGAHWSQAFRVDQGALGQGDSALYVYPLASASGGTNYGGPATARALLSYGNGLGTDFNLRPDIASGMSPIWDGWHIFHNGGPVGMLHHIYVDAANEDYAFAENDGSFYRLAAPPTGNGSDQVFTFPSTGGTLATTSDLPSSVAISLVAIAPQANVAGSATVYFVPTGAINFTASPNTREIAFPRSGTISNLYVCTGNTQPSTGSLVFTVMTGPWQGVLTSSPLSVGIAASTPAGCYQDPTDSLAYAAGQAIAIQVVNNANSTSAVFQVVYAEFTGAH